MALREILNKMKILIKAVAAMAVLFSVAGCSVLDKKEKPPCPRISVLAEAATLTKFRPGPGRDITDIEMTAELRSYRGFCAYDSKKKEMTVVLQVGVNAQRGPAATTRTVVIPYFVAIPQFYPKPEAKQTIDMKVTFPDGVNGVRAVDGELTIAFPFSNFKELDAYEIFVGLQLTEDQLDYNRESRK